MSHSLYLARHGETEWNRLGRLQGHTDIPLNEAGRIQARALGERLKGLGITHVGSSDLGRARETADLAAAVIGATRIDDDHALRERGFGAFEGLTRQELIERFPVEWTAWQSDPRAAPPGAETLEVLVTRVQAAVLRAAEGYSNEGSVLLVSHGAALRSLITFVRGAVAQPIPNGAPFRAVVEGGKLLDVTPVD